MKHPLMRALRIGVAALFITGAAGAAHAADAPDAWLTMKTKISLMTTEGVSTSDLNVDTVQGVVTLHGKVPTQSEKATAEAAARKVDGVKDVKNLLQVVPESVRPTLKVADDAIKTNLEASLKAEPVLSDVKVASVNNGVALLSGKTQNLADKLRAIEVAWAVQGVQRVASEIETKSN